MKYVVSYPDVVGHAVPGLEDTSTVVTFRSNKVRRGYFNFIVFA